MNKISVVIIHHVTYRYSRQGRIEPNNQRLISFWVSTETTELSRRIFHAQKTRKVFRITHQSLHDWMMREFF